MFDSESERKEPEYLTRRLEDNRGDIPNVDRLTKKLGNNATPEHILHAQLVLYFCNNTTYTITDVDACDGTYIVNIQLDGRINIGVWHGISTHGLIMEDQFNPAGRERNEKQHNISSLGGVKTNYEQDEKIMYAKLQQLPDDKLGIVLLGQRFTGFQVVSDCSSIPSNKCIIKLGTSARAALYRSNSFRGLEEAKKIASSLGLELDLDPIV